MSRIVRCVLPGVLILGSAFVLAVQPERGTAAGIGPGTDAAVAGAPGLRGGQSRRRDAEADRAALIKLEESWLAHEEDPAALESILADDFVHALPVGLIGKQEHIGFWRTHPAPRPQPAKSFEELRVRLYGDVGIANGIVKAVDAKGGVQKTVFTDVFVCRGGRWQAVNAQESPYQGSAAGSGAP